MNQTEQGVQAENIVLNGKSFTVIEEPGKLTFYDEQKKAGITLSGVTDAAAVKKDMAEQFKDHPFSVGLLDVGAHVSDQKRKDDGLYRNVSTERTSAVPKHTAPAVSSEITPGARFDRQIEAAKKAGRVQGVCECAAVVGDYKNFTVAKQLLSEMKVTKTMAQQFAKPETYKALEAGVFAQKQEHKLEQQQTQGRSR